MRLLYFLLIREHILFRGLRKRVLGNVTVMTAGSEAARGTECAGRDTGGGALLAVSSTLKAVNERACIVLLRPKQRGRISGSSHSKVLQRYVVCMETTVLAMPAEEDARAI